MKVVCFECNSEIGEKAPFSDKEITHTLCGPCLRAALKRLEDKRRRQRGQPWRHSPDLFSIHEG